MFMPWYWATLFIIVGLAICTAVTLSPLSRREARVDELDAGTLTEDEELALQTKDTTA